MPMSIVCHASTSFFSDRLKWAKGPAIRLSALVFVFAVLLEVAFLGLLPESYRSNDNSDYATFYAPMAQHIAEGKGPVFNGRLPARYPPGFPAYLVPLFYLSDRVGIAASSMITAANVVFTALGCVFLFWIAALLFTRRIGLIAAAIWAAYPFNLWLLKQPNSEVPFIAVFYLALWNFLRGLKDSTSGRFIAAGMLLGIATLIRPVAVLVPIVLIPILLWGRQERMSKRLLQAGLLAGAFVLPLLPWEAAVYSYDHELIFLSTGASHSVRDGLTFTRNFDKGRREHAWVPDAAEDLARKIYEHEPPLQTTTEVASYLAAELRSHPAGVAEMALLKAARSWYGNDAMTHELPIAMIQVIYLLLIMFGIRYAWCHFRESRLLMFALLAVVLYFWGMTTLVLSILRYMVPVMGLLVPFGAAGLASALPSVASGKLPRENAQLPR